MQNNRRNLYFCTYTLLFYCQERSVVSYNNNNRSTFTYMGHTHSLQFSLAQVFVAFIFLTHAGWNPRPHVPHIDIPEQWASLIFSGKCTSSFCMLLLYIVCVCYKVLLCSRWLCDIELLLSQRRTLSQGRTYDASSRKMQAFSYLTEISHTLSHLLPWMSE